MAISAATYELDPTDSQIRYLIRLHRERGMEWEPIPGLTRGEASELITEIKDIPVVSGPSLAMITEPGVYRYQGGVCAINGNRKWLAWDAAGRKGEKPKGAYLYARVPDETGKLVYAPGIVNHLTVNDRMTLDEAGRHGIPGVACAQMFRGN